ncbi:MAG TPA: hypothetical protein VN720_02665 [Rudaea sp.]|nr:hypothetical protein [Rudaea sp.]
MKAVYVRFFFAAAMALATMKAADAAKPADVYADVIITYAGQTFGFAGPLRYFEVADGGGRIGIDLTNLETPGYSPRPDVDPANLPTSGNRWQLVAYIGRSVQTIAGTCAVESFATTQQGVRMQHVYLNCVDLDV